MTTNASKKSMFNGRKMWFILSAAAALGAALVLLVIMNALTAKDTYYVLNQDIPARTAISADMLQEVQTSAGSAPPAALGIADVQGGETYSLYSLSAGDIITPSNTGDLLNLGAGLPENYVLASFTATPSMAVGGNIKRGDYIDIMSIVNDSAISGSEGPAASYVLQRVLVVDATINLDSYSADNEASSTTDGAATGDAASVNTTGTTGNSAIRSGIPTMFTVGLSPEAAQVLAVATQSDIYVVLSSATSSNDGKVPGPLTPATSSNVWGNAIDAGVGTDKTFGQGGDVTRPTEGGGSSTPTPNPSTSTEAPTDTSEPGGTENNNG